MGALSPFSPGLRAGDSHLRILDENNHVNPLGHEKERYEELYGMSPNSSIKIPSYDGIFTSSFLMKPYSIVKAATLSPA